MITTAVSNQCKQDWLNGVHQPGDTYKGALIKTGHAGTFDKTTDNYSDLGADEVANGSGYTTGGATLSGFSVGITGDVAHLSFSDPSWNSATFSADGILIYNSSKSNKVLGVHAFSNAPVSATNGTFTADLPAPGASALLRIG